MAEKASNKTDAVIARPSFNPNDISVDLSMKSGRVRADFYSTIKGERRPIEFDALREDDKKLYHKQFLILLSKALRKFAENSTI